MDNDKSKSRVFSVLIIDDEESVRNLVALMLRSHGHTVVTAADGAAGWLILCNQHFDAVITDLLMPLKDGFDLIRQIQSVFPQMKVIAISGAATARAYLDNTSAVAEIAQLPKPFSKQELLLTLEQMMNRISVKG